MPSSGRRVFREEHCLRDICVMFKTLLRLVLHFSFHLLITLIDIEI